MKSPKRSQAIAIGLLITATLCLSVSKTLPPPSEYELCKIQGQVVETGTAEGTDLKTESMTVPVVKIRLTSAKKSGIREASFIDCAKLLGGQTYTFSNCDKYDFKGKPKVEGLVGRSMGGGPNCIEDIKLLETDTGVHPVRPCSLIKCTGERCGCALLKQGWQVVHFCTGHNWSYVLEKGEDRLVCKGIDSRGGSTEGQCEGFTGDLNEFKKCK